MNLERRITTSCNSCLDSTYFSCAIQDHIFNALGIRGHWAIENSQHWVLDVTFREDECQIYADDGAVNLSTIRRKLLNIIKEHPLKDSVAGKMQRACWDAKFRAEILFGQKSTKAYPALDDLQACLQNIQVRPTKPRPFKIIASTS
jgi:hypothetical protein